MGKRWIAINLGLLFLFVFAAASFAFAEGEDGTLEPPPSPTAQSIPQTEPPGGIPTPTPTLTPVQTTPPDDSGGGPSGGATPSPVQEEPVPTPAMTEPETPSPAPEESQEPNEYTVSIQAQDAVVPLHYEAFSLFSLASAVTESGTHIAVRIIDDGGYNVHVAGAYRVLFGALHPVSHEEFYAACTVRVEGEEEVDGFETPEEAVPDPPKLSGTSDQRYKKYQQYRDEISEVLQTHMQRLNEEYAQRVTMLRSAFSDVRQHELLRRVFSEQEETDEWVSDTDLTLQHMSFEGVYEPQVTNWAQVLAVFVARSTLDVDEPLDLYNLRKISLDGIDEVFWDMHELSFQQNGEVLELVMREYAGEEMAGRYGFDAARKMQLDELLQPEFQRLFAALTGDASFTEISEAEIAAIRATLPAELNVHRESVVLNAHALVGNVNYFWGGKYQELGWNPLWGVPKVVLSENSETTGTVRPLGLDCSGFVSWVFINAAGDTGVSSAVGNGSANQWRNSRSLGWDEAEPGDLAFFAVPGTTATNHVGVVVEKKAAGSYMVAHCSSSKNNVVITEAWSTGFRYMRRPVLLGDA